MGLVVRRGRVIVVGLLCVGLAVHFLVQRASQENALHLSVAEELRGCGVDVSIVREPLMPASLQKMVLRVFPSFGPGPRSGARVTRVVFRPGSDGARAVRALCRLDRVRAITLYVGGRSEVLTVEQLGQLTSSLQPEVLYLEGLLLPRTAIPALNTPRLWWLLVARTEFSNAAIDSLPESLSYLDATRTRINDEGLSKFVRMKNLTTLILRRTPTSESAIDALREQMPWCEISWEKLDAAGG